MKHTPGPWWYDGREVMTVPRGDIKICRVHPVSEKDDGSANAALISAAPDLLEALEKIHSAGLAAVGYEDSPLGKQVQSAINKAKSP